MSDADKFRMLKVPSRNTLKPLTEHRKKDSITLKNTTIFKYQDWLVIGDSGGWCKACKMFVDVGKLPRVIGRFLTKPWTSYNRSRDLHDHADHGYHRDAMVSMGNFISITKGKALPIRHQLVQQAKLDLNFRKARLNTVVRSLVFCARAGIALRGHRNESLPFAEATLYDDDTILPDVNRGNFMATLEMRRQAGDERVDLNINKKSKYTSKDIQNDLLLRISEEITDQIVKDINESKYYSITADETRDSSNTEQLCVAIRYYNTKTASTEEKFLKFVSLTSLKGKYLPIMSLLKLIFVVCFMLSFMIRREDCSMYYIYKQKVISINENR